jgi:hypothetical protein
MLSMGHVMPSNGLTALSVMGGALMVVMILFAMR